MGPSSWAYHERNREHPMSDDDITTGGRQDRTEGADDRGVGANAADGADGANEGVRASAADGANGTDGMNPLAANTLESATPEQGNNLANDPAADPLWNPALEPHEPGSN
jgi:hypothetical protein